MKSCRCSRSSSGRRACWRCGCATSLGSPVPPVSYFASLRPTFPAFAFAASFGRQRYELRAYRRGSAAGRDGPRIRRKFKGVLFLQAPARLVATHQRAHSPLDRSLDGRETMPPEARHEPETLLANVLHEIRVANMQIEQRDQATRSRLSALEGSVNDLMKRAGRPGGGNGRGDVDERKSAI